ncbi:MAG: hypothetical protein ACKO0Z_29030 [Betaproteobacteria bacterium]
MTMEQTEFSFPDEEGTENPRKGGAVVEPEVDTDIEVVDDTPVADRNRKPMEEPPKDVTDEELAKYDESVQKRIKHFTKGYHEERRAKEAALREREEALKLAQTIVEENKKLKGTLSQGQTALLEQAKKNIEHEVSQARAKYKAAYESGDADALVEAQEELTAVKMKADKVQNFRPAPLQDTETEVQITQQQNQAPKLDPVLSDWQERNTWFGPNKRMTAYALGVHEDLMAEGIPAGSKEYYRRIDAEMQDRFSDVFGSEKPADAQTPPTRKTNVVAPATRSTAPRKVVLTKTQVEIAKRLGVPLELYARKVAEEMRK